jgi:hypothetical protein
MNNNVRVDPKWNGTYVQVLIKFAFAYVAQEKRRRKKLLPMCQTSMIEITQGIKVLRYCIVYAEMEDLTVQ